VSSAVTLRPACTACGRRVKPITRAIECRGERRDSGGERAGDPGDEHRRVLVDYGRVQLCERHRTVAASAAASAMSILSGNG